MSNDLDRDVDDGITHSNEPDCCEGKHYEPTTCDDHPLADLRKLTKWHEDQHPELGYLWGVERENRNLKADVKRLEAERGCPSCAHCQLKRGGHLD